MRIHKWLTALTVALALMTTACANEAASDSSPEPVTQEEQTHSDAPEELNKETESAASEETTQETTQTDGEQAEYPYDYTQEDFFSIENWHQYAPMAQVTDVAEGKNFFQLKAADGYSVLQGSCTDGTYGYFFLLNKSTYMDGDFISTCRLYKVDLDTWEIVGQSGTLMVDHGNSITYNGKKGYLVASSCTPNPNRVSLIDPESLEITEQFELPWGIMGITYNEQRDQYAVRFGGSKEFAILDADFQEIIRYEGADSGLHNQNIDNDDEYLYMMDTGLNTSPGIEAMLVYDWDGNYRGVYRIGSVTENEGMFNCGGVYYITFYTGGGRVYQLDFDKELLAGRQQ